MEYLSCSVVWNCYRQQERRPKEAVSGDTSAAHKVPPPHTHTHLTHTHTHTHSHFLSAMIISENNKKTKRTYHQNKSLSYEGSNKIPFGAELVLDSSEVLLNFLIATGFSGAITKTLSHSTVHWLLRGMSMSCVMTVS